MKLYTYPLLTGMATKWTLFGFHLGSLINEVFVVVVSGFILKVLGIFLNTQKEKFNKKRNKI